MINRTLRARKAEDYIKRFARDMETRKRAGPGEPRAPERDPRFQELDALIADEEKYGRNRTADADCTDEEREGSC